MSRAGTYRHLAEGVLRAKKLGKITLIDVEHGLRFMADLPAMTGPCHRAPAEPGRLPHPPMIKTE
jgi:hypothetical protein